MSKSIGNYIGISESPKEIYGKTMSIPDSMIMRYFELATTSSRAELEAIRKSLSEADTNPRDLKRRLAGVIVTMYHGPDEAETAEEEFDRVFAKGGLPDEIPEPAITVEGQSDRGAVWIVALLVATGLARSNGAARRLIEQGGIRLDGNVVSAVDSTLAVYDPHLLQAGKRRFVRILPENVTLSGE